MTVYATDWIRPALAIGSHLIRSAKEAASQTFKKGAPLGFTSGYLTAKTSGAVTDVIGIAIQDAHNDSSAGTHTIDYWPIETCPVWVGKLAGASPHTLAQTDLGTAYGLAASSGYWYVDVDESSSSQKCVTVVGFVDELSTSDGKVLFTFNKLGNPYVD